MRWCIENKEFKGRNIFIVTPDLKLKEKAFDMVQREGSLFSETVDTHTWGVSPLTTVSFKAVMWGTGTVAFLQ